MKRLVLVVVTALVVAPAMEAKFRLTLKVSPASPAVGRVVHVAIAADVSPDEDVVMRLVAVAPRAGLYAALSAESRGLDPAGASFAVPLTRDGVTWTGALRFPRRGTWRLVVPNWGAPGYALPPPIVRTIVVR